MGLGRASGVDVSVAGLGLTGAGAGVGRDAGRTIGRVIFSSSPTMSVCVWGEMKSASPVFLVFQETKINRVSME